jgi:HNH endonuclease
VSATFVCPYCGETRDRAEQSLEHPLARALGGSGYSSLDFCAACNERAGREVDQPFASHHIMLTMRHMFGIRDAYGHIPPAPRLYGDIEGGGRVYLELGGVGVGPQARRVPHKAQDDETGRRYVVDEGEGEAFAERMKARLEQQLGDGFQVEAQVERIEEAEQEASVPVGLPLKLWPRFGAKLGLAFGREVLGDEWLLTEDAGRLRRVLWDTEEVLMLEPLWDQVEEDDPFTLLAPPPGHLVAVAPRGEGCSLIVQLFGGLRYAVPLSDQHSVDLDWTVWTFDPVAGTARKTTLGALIAEQSPDAGPV